MLTNTSALAERLEAARKRERDARAEASRLKRELAALSRRQESQLLCTVGRAWLAWGERNEVFRAQAHRFLCGYITRETDREILRGTTWEVPEPASHAEPSSDGHSTSQGGDHDRD